MIMPGAIIQWIGQPRMERVLYIDGVRVNVVLIPINPGARNPWPYWAEMADIEGQIEKGTSARRPVDPYAWLDANIDVNSRDLAQLRRQPLGNVKRYLHKCQAWHEAAVAGIDPIVAVEPDIYLGGKNNQLIKDRAAELGIDRRTLWKWLIRYWMAGKRMSAVTLAYYRCGVPSGTIREPGERKRGRPPYGCDREKDGGDPDLFGRNIDENVRRLIRSFVLYFLRHDSDITYDKIRCAIVDEFFLPGKMLKRLAPGTALKEEKSRLLRKGQFYYWLHRLFTKEELIKLKAGRTYLTNKRPLKGNARTAAIGPGSIFQIDSTVVDVYVVASWNRALIIGRLVLYLVVDVFSSLICGVHWALEGPNWEGAAAALANAMMDKTDFCRRYGVQIEPDMWPSFYLPEKVVGDRGELVSDHADYLQKSLDIVVGTTAPFRPDWKPFVEEKFRLLNLMFLHWCPGSTKGRMRQRGEPDHRLDGVYTIREFAEMLLLNIQEYNHNHWIEHYPYDKLMVARDVKPIPIGLWEHGVQYRSHLRDAAPDRVRKSLMRHYPASVTPKGIKWGRFYYESAYADQQGWLTEARAEGRRKVMLCIDRRSIDVAYLVLDAGTESERYEACPRRKETNLYDGLDLEESMEWWVSTTTRRNRYEPTAAKSRAELDQRLQNIHDEAAEKTRRALEGFKRSQRIKNMRLNRAMEAAVERVTDQPGTSPLPALLPEKTAEHSPQDEVVQRRKSAHLALLEQLTD